MSATDIKPTQIDAKIIQLNHDLAPLGQQIADLLQRFNEETDGHAADVLIDCDWRKHISLAEPIGQWVLVKVGLNAKATPLPRGRIR
jgi:hypothetical protein